MPSMIAMSWVYRGVRRARDGDGEAGWRVDWGRIRRLVSWVSLSSLCARWVVNWMMTEQDGKGDVEEDRIGSRKRRTLRENCDAASTASRDEWDPPL